jgi:Na+-transporting NADH:ubiquinone oxidoreductase subunit NqrB
MINLIDSFLNRVTMYVVLVLYYLIFLVIAGIALSFSGLLPFRPLDLFVSLSVLVFVCWITNGVFAKVFRVPANTESVYITAFILALIITPRSPSRFLHAAFAIFLWAGVWSMASKYLLAIRKHILIRLRWRWRSPHSLEAGQAGG